MTSRLAISVGENTDVEPNLKRDSDNECDHTCDREPEPIRENRTQQNCDGQQVIIHVDTRVGPDEYKPRGCPVRGRSPAHGTSALSDGAGIAA